MGFDTRYRSPLARRRCRFDVAFETITRFFVEGRAARLALARSVVSRTAPVMAARTPFPRHRRHRYPQRPANQPNHSVVAARSARAAGWRTPSRWTTSTARFRAPALRSRCGPTRGDRHRDVLPRRERTERGIRRPVDASTNDSIAQPAVDGAFEGTRRAPSGPVRSGTVHRTRNRGVERTRCNDQIGELSRRPARSYSSDNPVLTRSIGIGRAADRTSMEPTSRHNSEQKRTRSIPGRSSTGSLDIGGRATTDGGWI